MILNNKIIESNQVIVEALKKYRCGVAFSGGKDSLVLLHLVKQKEPEISVLFVDTHVKFSHTYSYISTMEKKWNLNIHHTRAPLWNKELWERDKAKCCERLKVTPLMELVKELRLEALFVGIRHDEHPARKQAKYFDTTGSATYIDYVRYNHWRIHPLLDWSEEDIWGYIHSNNLPYNPLYDEGYRSIGCEPCTKPSLQSERGGREQDKEFVLERLRRLGYF